MLKHFILCIIALAPAAAAAPPTSRPATKPAASSPSTPTLAEAQAAYESAVERANDTDTAYKKEREEALARIDASPAIVELARRVGDAEYQLQQARASGTPQQKLDASASFNRARALLNAARKSAIDSDERLHDLARIAIDAAAAVKPAETALQDARVREAARQARLQEEREAKDPIVQAIRQHQLVIGMTLEQAKKALSKGDVELAEEADGAQVYRWKFYRDAAGPPELTSIHWAEFRDGKLVRHWKD